MTGSDFVSLTAARAKLILLSLFGFAVIVAGSVGAMLYKKPQPAPVIASTPFVSSSTDSFWKEITVNEERQQAYFCRDGSYQGRIHDTGQGWWETWEGEKKSASYASEQYAKAAIEKAEPCK